MTSLPRLGSGHNSNAKPANPRDGDVLLGEDWVSPETLTDEALRADRHRRGIVSLNRSPLARKIIVFNLLALVILVSGVLFMNPFRDSLVLQREEGLVTEAKLIANVFEAQIPGTGAVNMASGDGPARRSKAAFMEARLRPFICMSNRLPPPKASS